MTTNTKLAELPDAWRATSKAAGSTSVAATLNVCAAELESALSQQSPSYDALNIIALSVAAALERAGVTECDDPGEAIDVLVQGYERTIARLSDAPSAPEQRAAPAERLGVDDDLPPLPDTEHWLGETYTAAQMRWYAREALAARALIDQQAGKGADRG